ncbi:MAG: 30S ribosomal protein THX [Sphingobacterium composti]|nr:30S ribosomal protein THX [Sphingobacterium composti Ten et al. 2007 non Yoo et al. 2007]
MGKGDRKTTKGKIIMGSYGKKRPGKKAFKKKDASKETE